MKELPKIFDAQTAEPELIELWLSSGAYQQKPGTSEYVMVIPPPNVTGILHMGHAMGDTIQDTLIRYHRMNGASTRWILGTDHAGIATQTKVDKHLKSKGLSRLEMGRDAFLDACWEWKEEFGGTIVSQIKRMGCSIDFDHEHFTMSEEFSSAVRKVFCDWYRAGLIYRGKRIVNWCPQCCTAISDDEAEYLEEDGHLYHLRYPLETPQGDVEYVCVATTRPETMLGDTGIAVSPSDESKKHLVGAHVIVPIVNRRIPIFEDWHVDANFGSGFVKVTPAHDPNDYAMGQTHNLESINVFDEHARVVEGYGEFSGMSREEARVAIVAWFEEHGLLDHIDDHHHSVMHCYRCDTSLEPWLSEQWFVAVDKLKGPALEVVQDQKLRFHTDRWTQSYTTWMEGLKDWCISRQLWWGHRIPFYSCPQCGWHDVSEDNLETCPQCGHVLEQDPDVLDTWFSSQLWTFATQGWPEDVEKLCSHPHTHTLVTARDIIALWVARMVMSSLYFTKQLPFTDVFITPTVLAKDGSRMSKSKGNGVNPMDLIDKYGADAMRFNLLSLVTANQDVKFDAVIDKKTHEFIESPRTEQARAFVTKIWNASRFVQMNLDGYTPGEPELSTFADAWIFSRLASVVTEAREAFEAYNFGAYTRLVQNFFWNEVCDWYLELCKATLTDPAAENRLQIQRNLMVLLKTALKLIHPAMPFVTEGVWQNLFAGEAEDSQFLMHAAWPQPAAFAGYRNAEAEESFELMRAVVQQLRAVRARYKIAPKTPLTVTLRLDVSVAEAFKALASLTERMAVCTLQFGTAVAPQPGALSIAGTTFELFVDLEGLVDFQAELARMTKELQKVEKDVASLQKTLGNEGFIAKADPAIVAQKQEQLTELLRTQEQLTQQVSEVQARL